MSLKVGSLEYISIDYKPANADFSPSYSYDDTIIEVSAKDNGVVIKGLQEGQTEFSVSCNNRSATCIISVTGYEIGYEKILEPYIYSNTNILQLSPEHSEKIFVSLYGGTAADINDYSWTIEDNSVGTIQPTGQYCLIKAKSAGYTRIKVTHPKAAYPFYMGMYVFDDPSNATFITTPNNILTMNMDDNEKTVNVSLVNGYESSLDSAFNWEIIDSNSNDCPINLNYNGARAVVTPKKNGCCTVRITHPDAVYPLDILCRVISIVKNVYIEPDKTVITLDGQREETISSNLININIGEYSINDYSYSIQNPEVAEITTEIGNMVSVRGLKNGSTKLIIGHPTSAYTREVLLISTNQLADAIDASCFITTTQNYIRTKVGASQTELNISLKGGDDGDEKDFVWTVKSTASDGSNDDVISLETPTGKAIFSRLAKSTLSFGNAYITPLKEGTAVITVSHPKVLYPTEILIKVLSQDAVLEEPLYFKGDGLVRILNGQSFDYTVTLNGTNKKPDDIQNISWTSDDVRLSVVGNEDKATITAPSLGTGQTISHINISHPKVDYPKSVLILTADDEETLMNMKALYTDKDYYNIEVGKTIHFGVETIGFDDDYDFSLMRWSVDKTGIIDYTATDTDKRYISITGLKSGTVKLTASIEDCECVFTITVLPVGAVQTQAEYYFTTSQNVVVFGETNIAKVVQVVAVNMPSIKYNDITWTCSDESICTVIPNRTSATISSLKEGEAIITVSHPESQNNLKIYVKIGSEYLVQDSSVVYISSQDVMTMLKDDQAQKLQAVLANYNGNDGAHFNFSIDNENVAKISAQSVTGTAFIKPVGSGQAEVTITNSLADISKKVLIVVGNSAEELAGITYLTTSNNVVSIGEGRTKTVSVSVKNSDEIILDGYSWVSSNYSVADVIENGATASIKANSQGTAIITVTNTHCTYPLQIIVHVVDPIAAAANPYIQLSSSVMVIDTNNTYSSVTAELVGGDISDYSNFIWTSNNSQICNVYGQNEVGKIKGISEGTTFITVSHPKANYTAQILVICEKKMNNDCYISVPTSVINMKPTDDFTTITATLINGDINDKYNFNWSMDVYDIVDMQYSANVCTIRPKQAGTTNITISHPKADYDQQIIVTVQEYSSFAFPSTNITVLQGDVKFVNMQVPVTTVKTHVEYYVKNENICSISGTKEVAQITGITNGTTTVTAKLIASNSGIEQASADMMVYIKERATTDAYITSSSTIYTVTKGKSQTLKATITGTDVNPADQAGLKWNTSDSDIIELTGIGADGYVKGSSIYITAKKPGEAIITCSHEKAKSALEFYVVVPGTEKKIITLDKTYLTAVKGSQNVTVKATIENAESNDDYNNLEWKSVAANGLDGSSIARVMGSGKTVHIYPVSPGEVTIYASLPDTDSVGKCTVIVEAGKSFSLDTTGLFIHPYEVKEIPYKVSPNNAVISWNVNTTTGEDYFTFEDLGYDSNGNGKVQITGIKEGQGFVIASTDGGATGRMTVKCGWTYDFKIQGNTTFNIDPKTPLEVTYTVCPKDAIITVDSADIDDYFIADVLSYGEVVQDDYMKESLGKGSIKITPLRECDHMMNITLRATNPVNNQVVGEIPIRGYSKYRNLEVEVKNPNRVVGKWSRYSDDKIILGDGEKIQLSLVLKQTDADAYVKRVEYNKKVANSWVKIQGIQSGNNYEMFVEHQQDIINTWEETYYYINNLYYDPEYPQWTAFHWEHFRNSNGKWLSLVKPGYSLVNLPEYDVYDDKFGTSHLYYPRYGAEGMYLGYRINDKNPTTSFGYKYYEEVTYGLNNVEAHEQGKDVIIKEDALRNLYSNIWADQIHWLSSDINDLTYWIWNFKDKKVRQVPFKWAEGWKKIYCSWQEAESWEEQDTNVLTEDLSYRGTRMSVYDFEHSPWLYCPGTIQTYEHDFSFSLSDIENGTYQNGKFGNSCVVAPHIMTENVNAEKLTETCVSSNDAVQDYVLDGFITVYLTHCGKEEMTDLNIPVYVETRECRCK